MIESGNDASTTGPRMMLVVYTVVQMQYTKLLPEDIYDADNHLIVHGDYDLIIGPIPLLTKQMMNSHNNAKCDALKEAIKFQDVDIYLLG
jgi:hypothetical protein